MYGFAASGVVGAFFLLLLFWRWQGTRRPGARLALASAPHRGNGPHPGGASSQLRSAQRHLSRRHVALRSAAHRRGPGDSAPCQAGAGRHGSVVVRDARGDECDGCVATTTVSRPDGPLPTGWLRLALRRHCIGETRHWSEYHGAFDEWLAATLSRLRPSARRSLSRSTGSDARSFLRLDGGPVMDATYRLTSGLRRPWIPAGRSSPTCRTAVPRSRFGRFRCCSGKRRSLPRRSHALRLRTRRDASESLEPGSTVRRRCRVVSEHAAPVRVAARQGGAKARRSRASDLLHSAVDHRRGREDGVLDGPRLRMNRAG